MADDPGMAPGIEQMHGAEIVASGLLFGMLIIAVMGALFITGEYSTGMIRSTFAAVPTRLPVLAALTVLLLLPGTLNFVTIDWVQTIVSYLPLPASSTLLTTGTTDVPGGDLTTHASLIVVAAYAVVPIVAAAAALRRRDAATPDALHLEDPKELSTMAAENVAVTEHLVLRPMASGDAPALAAYRSDPVQARYQSWETPTPWTAPRRSSPRCAKCGSGSPAPGSRSPSRPPGC